MRLPEVQGDLRVFRQPARRSNGDAKGEVDRDTYRLFDLQTGVPTDAYGLDEAVKDGFLVPPKAVSLTTDFLDRCIRYDQLSDEEKEAWTHSNGTRMVRCRAPSMRRLSTSGCSTPTP